MLSFPLSDGFYLSSSVTTSWLMIVLEGATDRSSKPLVQAIVLVLIFLSFRRFRAKDNLLSAATTKKTL